MTDDSEDHGGASPCYAQDIVGGHAVDAQTRRDVARFRKGERERLYALRKDVSQAQIQAQASRIADALDTVLGDLAGRTVAAYWPIRGELDMRPWMTRITEAGAQVALPVGAGAAHGFSLVSMGRVSRGRRSRGWPSVGKGRDRWSSGGR